MAILNSAICFFLVVPTLDLADVVLSFGDHRDLRCNSMAICEMRPHLSYTGFTGLSLLSAHYSNNTLAWDVLAMLPGSQTGSGN